MLGSMVLIEDRDGEARTIGKGTHPKLLIDKLKEPNPKSWF